jgi:hypothetical protein
MEKVPTHSCIVEKEIFKVQIEFPRPTLRRWDVFGCRDDRGYQMPLNQKSIKNGDPICIFMI